MVVKVVEMKSRHELKEGKKPFMIEEGQVWE
jgi:hypothetical protein